MGGGSQRKLPGRHQETNSTFAGFRATPERPTSQVRHTARRHRQRTQGYTSVDTGLFFCDRSTKPPDCTHSQTKLATTHKATLRSTPDFLWLARATPERPTSRATPTRPPKAPFQSTPDHFGWHFDKCLLSRIQPWLLSLQLAVRSRR